jgi:hypothetical protein
MPLHALPDDRAVEHVQSGEQGRRAVADIVMGHRAGPAPLHRQPGLRAIQSLDLTFLVDREDDGMGRRVDIETDDVADLAGELRIARELEGPQPVRCQAVGAPDLLHRADRQAHDLGHRPAGPVRRLARRLAERPLDELLDDRERDRCLAGLARLVAQQAVDALLHEAPLPAPDAGLGDAGPALDLRRAVAFGRGEDDPCPPDVLLGAVPIGQNGFQPLPITRPKPDLDIAAHARIVHRAPAAGNLLFRADH